VDHPEWGSSLMPHLRFLPPSYGNGIESDRKSVSGNALPSPRRVSSSVHQESSAETPMLTMMVMQWGQFISHDVTFTPMSRGFNKSMIKCCSKEGQQVLRQMTGCPKSKNKGYITSSKVTTRYLWRFGALLVDTKAWGGGVLG
jgi:hypothetical protein